jgi:hypothetical protein
MEASKVYKFKILGHEAIMLDGRMEISVPHYDDGSKLVLKLSNAILDKKIKSLRINLPNKIIFISAHDNNHILMRAEESNNKKEMN